jgi:hypothetical protein
MPAAIIIRVIVHFLYIEMSPELTDIAISCAYLSTCIIMIKIVITKYINLIGYTPNLISALAMIVMMEDSIKRSPDVFKTSPA